MARSDTALLALQACLATEHEAVWWYSQLAARLARLDAPARTSYARHRQLRDELLALLHASQASNPRPATDYAFTGSLRAASASAHSQALESRCSTGWLRVIGVSTGADRQLALKQLRAAALAELDWGGKPGPFPGLDPTEAAVSDAAGK